MKKWLYKNTKNNEARFLLGEIDEEKINQDKKIIVCIGINPSTAEPNNLDNTLTIFQKFSKENNFHSWCMLNVYPQRATNPNDMHEEIDKKIHLKNLQEIQKFLGDKKCLVWCAWGTIIEKRNFLKECLQDLIKALPKSAEYFTRGKKSIKGHPHHPLYLKKDSKMEIFDIKKYFLNK